jgi:cytochrome c
MLRVIKTVTILGVVTVFLLSTSSLAQATQPDQFDRGQAIYTHYCSTCHGDRGQGLTDEFRATWPPQDQNCWKSKCHAANHPPGGFVFPKIVPAVIGSGTLVRFETAQQLYTFMQSAMPYYAPGLLNSDQYWDLAAFLLSSNQVKFDGSLSPDNAALIRLRPGANAAAPSTFDLNLIVPIGLVLAAGIFILGLTIWRRRSPGKSP